jgi:branched-chain amino acid transport system ATP-binding protein
MLLEIRNLCVHYGISEVLKNVSIVVEEGAIVAIIGGNGAGKTTILRTISGLKRPTSGEIWFEGKRIDRVPPPDIVRMGITLVPEGRLLFPTMTVLDNLKMGAYLRTDKRQILENLDGVYDLFPVLKRRSRQQAGTLSGGEQQMVAIGRALMARAMLILLDEPSTGLSPLLVKELGSSLRRINQEGKSIVLVEQNARMALKLAKRAYLLEVGYVVTEGKASDLVNDERVRRAYLGG